HPDRVAVVHVPGEAVRDVPRLQQVHLGHRRVTPEAGPLLRLPAHRATGWNVAANVLKNRRSRDQRGAVASQWSANGRPARVVNPRLLTWIVVPERARVNSQSAAGRSR